MSKVDDELTRRLRRAERPVDADGLFEGLERRRSHRERMRKVQAGMLALAVLTATAGGFVALRQAFDSGRRDTGEAPASANGEIVFVRDGEDGRLHIHASQPDGSGLRQLTEGDSNDSDPTVSPDGRTVAFARGMDGLGGATIATVPIEGGPLTWQTAEHYDVTDPAWSPDGSQIAFIGHTADAAANLYVAEVGSDEVRQIALAATESAHPSWSPDGTLIAVAAYPATNPSTAADLAAIRSNGAGVEWLVTSSDADEQAPAWSPDGSRIAFLKPGEQGHEVWTMSADGSSQTLVATAVEASLLLDLDWAPDGSSLLVSDGDWIYRVDATPEGDPRDNFVQLMRGFSPSWQPIRPGSSPSATASPEPSPQLEGRDIGLGFNLCHDDRLGGVDFLGDGTKGQAWVGVPTKDDGTCPGLARAGAYVVVADADADGQADAWSHLPWECSVDCVPYAAVDLDRNGPEELIVASYFSIMDYYVLAYTDVGEPSPRISPILIAEPGHQPAGLIAGDPLRIDAGGDAGYSSEIMCQPPVLAWTWSFAPIDSNDPAEVHYVELELQDAAFVVVGTNDYTVPAGEPTGVGDDTEPSCGVDWHPSA